MKIGNLFLSSKFYNFNACLSAIFILEKSIGNNVNSHWYFLPFHWRVLKFSLIEIVEKITQRISRNLIRNQWNFTHSSFERITLNPKVLNFDPKVDQSIVVRKKNIDNNVTTRFKITTTFTIFYIDFNCFFPLKRFDPRLDENLILWDLVW